MSIRGAGRHQGSSGWDRRLGPGGSVPVQVPDQGHRRHLLGPLDGQRPVDEGYERHIDRLHEEVRWLPCTPACGNWLRFGVQPKDAGPGLVPGCAARRRTTGRTSAWAVVGSWCLGSGRVRRWPSTARTGATSSRRWSPRGSTRARPTGWPPTRTSCPMGGPATCGGRRGGRGRLRRGHRRVPSSGQGLAGPVRAGQGACRAARITACEFCFGNGQPARRVRGRGWGNGTVLDVGRGRLQRRGCGGPVSQGMVV